MLCFITWYIQSKIYLLNLSQRNLCLVQNMTFNTGCSLAPLWLLKFKASAIEYSSTILSVLYTSYECAATVRCMLLVAQACRALRESCCTATHTARRPTRRALAASAWQSSALATRRSISPSNFRTFARRHATLYTLQVYTICYNFKI